MPDLKFTFRKAERLCNKKIIRELFEYTGPRVITEYPYLIKWMLQPGAGPSRAQVLVAVSRKNFWTAVTRNRIKRQIREQYRLHKHRVYEVLEQKDLHAAILIMHSGSLQPGKEAVKQKFEKLFENFTENIVQTT